LNNKYSYTAAGTLPAKLIGHDALKKFKETKKIDPIHAQICPTNKCNLQCGFCSCDNVDKEQELSFNQLADIAYNLNKLGTKAVTITGGGEPLMHGDIESILDLFLALNIEVGLVTNGIKLRSLDTGTLDALTWCRISCSDEITFNRNVYNPVDLCRNVDFAFSYVVTDKYKPENLAAFIDYANKKNFSHVRVVSDLIDLDNVPTMDDIKFGLSVLVDDSLVIYQARQEYTRGSKNCYISQLKPLIAADGNVYPCCGVQYAKTANDQELNFPKDMRMGYANNIETLKKALYKPFDGSNCDKCYYEPYNEVLGAVDGEIKHGDFL